MVKEGHLVPFGFHLGLPFLCIQEKGNAAYAYCYLSGNLVFKNRFVYSQ